MGESSRNPHHWTWHLYIRSSDLRQTRQLRCILYANPALRVAGILAISIEGLSSFHEFGKVWRILHRISSEIEDSLQFVDPGIVPA